MNTTAGLWITVASIGAFGVGWLAGGVRERMRWLRSSYWAVNRALAAARDPEVPREELARLVEVLRLDLEKELPAKERAGG